KPIIEIRNGEAYLSFKSDPLWAKQNKRKLVTTKLLGKAVVPNQNFTNPDGTPLSIEKDYFGKKRNIDNPFPGAFETPVNGEIKVWPKTKN
ncbi:MAG TPA: hypothetical protein VL088_05970, partial [Pedobacter sp.]|nr:hypothetical protein [Pedobacter sp.]